MPAYRDKARGTWYFAVWVRGKKILRRGFATKNEALSSERIYLVEQNQSPVSQMKFVDLYGAFLKWYETRVKARSVYDHEKLAKVHLLPVFGDKAVAKIRPQDILSWQTEINDHSPAYAFEYKTKLYRIFKQTIRFGMKYYDIPDIFQKIEPFRNNQAKKEMKFWVPSEYDQFRAVIDDQIYGCLFDTLYLTGMRIGELQALKFRDVDFEKNTISISKTYVDKPARAGKDEKNRLSSPKTPNSVRSIYMTDKHHRELEEYVKMAKRVYKASKNDFLFGIDAPLSLKTISNRKVKYIKESGVKSIRLHDFRHSHAALLISKGANIMVIAKRLGHSDIKMTLNTYGHMFREDEDKVIKNL